MRSTTAIPTSPPSRRRLELLPWPFQHLLSNLPTKAQASAARRSVTVYGRFPEYPAAARQASALIPVAEWEVASQEEAREDLGSLTRGNN